MRLKDEILKELKENLFNSMVFGKVYYEPDIPEKVKNKLMKYFDSNLNKDDVIGFVDTTLIKSCKGGMVFTTYGLYYLGMFHKSKYFNYNDIDIIEIIPSKNRKSEDASLKIISNDKEDLTIGSGEFNKYKLKDLLQNIKIICNRYNNENVLEKPNGKVEKLKINKEQQIKCQAIIHTASIGAGGVGTGLAQIPLSDNAVLIPIQITMITSIGAVFGIRVTEGAAKGILSSLVATFVGRGATQLLLGWVPGVGNVINTATAAGITEAAGWLAVKHFSELKEDEKMKYSYEGKKDGYEKASKVYEEKFHNQESEFKNSKKKFTESINEYEEIVKCYEEYISELERKESKSRKEEQDIEIAKAQLNNLYNIKKVYYLEDKK